MRSEYLLGRIIICSTLLGATGAGLIGCTSNRPPQPRQIAEHSEVIRAFSPEWYETTPKGGGNLISKTAQAVGVNPIISESLAINIARQAMAMSVESRVDAMQRNFLEQLEASKDFDLIRRFQDASTIVTSTALRGSHVVRKETYLEDDGTYRTFVLMQLDPREIDASVLDTAKAIENLETRLQPSEAWSDLVRRTNQWREEHRKDTADDPKTDG